MTRGAEHHSIVSRFLGRPRQPLAVLLLGAWAHVGIASAAEAVDCAGINVGQLDVVLASGSSTLRAVEMNEGDTLTFAFRAEPRATGTVIFVAGNGREQRLLHGPHATQASYTATRSGAVGFRLATQGGKVATFVTTCNPARGLEATAQGGLNVDMSVPFAFGTAGSKDTPATTVAAPNMPTLQWLGGEQAGKEAPPGTYGVNLKLQPALSIGVLAQFHQAGAPLLGPAALSDQPWLAGPVTSMRLGGGLSLDARAAWGAAEPAMGYAADRQTLDARLTSKQEAGPWRFTSSIALAHVQERLGTATGHSADVPGHQTVESGRVDVKPEMAYRIDMGHSIYIEPKIMVGTFWSLGDAAGTATGAPHDPRLMAETGITFGAADGTKLQLGGSVQEGGTRSDDVWSGRLQLNIPLE